MELPEIVEALIFASPEPISAKDLARVIRNKVDDSEDEEEQQYQKIKADQVEKAIDQLNATYKEQARSFTLVNGPSGWRMYTRPEFADWIRELFPGQKPAKLSPPALETLAIIAYRQPITKADIEAVRGVSVDGVIQKLTDRGLVRIAGRADVPGRPLLYGTSDLFMDHFGIRNLEDLPNSEELRAVPLPKAEAEEKPVEETEKQLALSAVDKGESQDEQEDSPAPSPEEPEEKPADPEPTPDS